MQTNDGDRPTLCAMAGALGALSPPNALRSKPVHLARSSFGRDIPGSHLCCQQLPDRLHAAPSRCQCRLMGSMRSYMHSLENRKSEATTHKKVESMLRGAIHKRDRLTCRVRSRRPSTSLHPPAHNARIKRGLNYSCIQFHKMGSILFERNR